MWHRCRPARIWCEEQSMHDSERFSLGRLGLPCHIRLCSRAGTLKTVGASGFFGAHRCDSRAG